MTKIFIADAFTSAPFSGNPAAVCILEEDKTDKWLSDVAAEMNLSETAFVKKEKEGFSLRWFTPVKEVGLCGHATLASSHILWQKGYIDQNETAVFQTRISGILKAVKNGDEITLDFPSLNVKDCDSFPELESALGVKPVYTGVCGNEEKNYLIELESEIQVRELKPDFGLLSKLPKSGVIITAISQSADYDFVSRYFAPAYGINEDPVTGSAHCSLTPYWSKRSGKTEMNAFQASSRGGMIKVKLDGDRVFLAGNAVTILEGNLLV